MTGLTRGFPVRIRMLSDWIVGTGEGRVGDVDATVRRDYDGLPFIPAKTLTGIWRDACEQVAGWLGGPVAPDDGNANPWNAWVDWIFGSQPGSPSDRNTVADNAPQRAALALSPARMPEPVRSACRGRPALLAAAVLVRPGVEIDDVTGVARDKMLRREERARPGTLWSRADFPFLAEGEIPGQAEFLLRAGAALVDALGGKRNRGAGRCLILLPGVDDTGDPAARRPADERLRELSSDTAMLDDPGDPPGHDMPAPRLAPLAGAAHGDRPGSPGGVGARKTYRITLEVITPLVAQQRVLGNVVMSRDWVPGTVLLPVILSRLDGRRVGHKDIVVGDARPACANDRGVVPGLPVPMTWYRPKDRRCREFAVNAAVRRPDPAERLQPMRSGHVAGNGDGTWLLLAPEMTVSTHAVIGDDTGRPDSDRGGVFSNLGIAPGTLLVSDVVLPDDVRLTLVRGEELRLGRARKDDFGQVKVVDVWVVPPQLSADLRPGERVSVWCVSDVLLRDAWGAPDPSPEALAVALSDRLRVEMTVVPQAPGGLVTQEHRAARRESFHTRWGRPRPTLTGLQAGSVVTLMAAGEIPASVLAEIERDGIGERTAEGFGQVRFSAPELTVLEPRLVPGGGQQARPEPAGQASAGELPDAPHILERAAVLSEVGRQVARIVVDAAAFDQVIPGTGRVTRSQWGSLREQLPRLRTEAGLQAVIGWLAKTGQVRQRCDAWGDPALKALTRLFTDRAAIWADLGLDGAALDEFTLAPSRAEAVRDVLWADAVAALLTEISRTACKRLQSEPGEGDQP